MSTAPRSRQARRWWGDDDSGTDILHVDMDSFFAAVEIADNPELAGVPLIVGGNRLRGVVTACTYDVRAKGVRAGMPVRKAIDLAPEAVVLAGNHRLYRDYSRRVMEILSDVTPAIEIISIDEAYLDVSGARRRLGSPLQIAAELRRRIHATLGLPASVGIGNSKTVAKIASSHAKPDGVLLIPAGRTVEFLHELPVGALPGVGGRTEEGLRRRGIDTVGQLAHVPLGTLMGWVGESHARHLARIAQGDDPRPVGQSRQEKSISTEKTFSVNVTQRSQLEKYLLEAAHDCAQRARAEDMVAWTVVLKMRDANFRTITRSYTRSAPTDLGRDVARDVLELLSRERIPHGGVRLAGVGLHNLSPRRDGYQVSLEDDRRPAAAERAMDAIAARYGGGAITHASLLEGTPDSNSPPAKKPLG